MTVKFNWNLKLQYISKFTANCRREKPVLGSKKDVNKLDRVQWRATKMVRELEHFSVRRQECWAGPAWRRLQGTWAAAFHTCGVHRDEVSRLAKRDVWQEDKVRWQTESRDILSEYWEPVHHEESSIRPGHSRDVVHLHSWRFSRPFTAWRTWSEPHTWPVFEQEVGLETSWSLFQPKWF